MDALKAITDSQPPATDSLSWLVIVEVNLSSDLLPAFNEILLKDPELTSQVGWDLIPLLLPFKGNQDCLRTIGRYGNPRECVINVCEQLRGLKFENDGDDDEEEGEGTEHSEPKSSPGIAEEGQELESDGQGSLDVSKMHITEPIQESEETNVPTETDKLISLIRLLAALHPRIQTKHPSRFLSTSLSALLSTYSDAVRFVASQEITLEIIRLIKTISGVKRPHLPQRYSSQLQLATKNEHVAGDPEATDEPPAPEEQALATRLLTSFVTHVLEDFIDAMPEPGISWSTRFHEIFNPTKVVSGTSIIKRFTSEEPLRERDAISGQLVALARDLILDDDELLKTLTQPVVQIERTDDGPPSSPSDIPLSEAGSLFLLACRIASSTLFGSSTTIPPLFIFPDHAAICFKFIGQAEAGGSNSIGSEPAGVIDAILAIGLHLVNTGKFGDPVYEGEEKFNQYLQDLVRLAFIRDTLEHCPFENLRGSAVEWFKTETLSPTTTPDTTDDPSIFTTPVALDLLAPFLYPNLSEYGIPLTDEALSNQWINFKANFSFYVAALNLLYLLLRSVSLRDSLDVLKAIKAHSIQKDHIDMLGRASALFKEGLKGPLGKVEGEHGVNQATFDLYVLDDALERVRSAGMV
ncbi:MAG: hypothetical protein M1814_006344 [Vezdaea aestivalis]|nr:MAG: hypothetical protein M1814_006344 [Vezdaea aestivalis]